MPMTARASAARIASGLVSLLLIGALAAAPAKTASAEGRPSLSPQSAGCLGCHESATPGIVADWRASRHSRVSPKEALAKPALERRISAEPPEALMGTAVGCYECHGLNTTSHRDSFDHFGFRIMVVVSPSDCSTCHKAEAEQYAGSKKAHAVGNLRDNPLYFKLVRSIIGVQHASPKGIEAREPTDQTMQDTCFSCHGTEVKAIGTKLINTPDFGPVEVPHLTNWPNQGVGRLNPDGSMGACTSCHARHAFSIEVARKPYTCAQCHLEPDTPAWNVYAESKHGNIFLSKGADWDFNAVPWTVGRDYTAPTCASCHNSLVVRPDGVVSAERTHDFGARLWVRLFGLPMSHPQPKHGDTTVIRNRDKQPLPTTFTGLPASEYLIGKEEQGSRMKAMARICGDCHSTDWSEAHFRRMHNTITEADAMALEATLLMQSAWERGMADAGNPFDEPLEKKWIKQWLFHANSTKYASAMSGAPDYTSFKYGWWGMSENLAEMREKVYGVHNKEKAKPGSAKKGK